MNDIRAEEQKLVSLYIDEGFVLSKQFSKQRAGNVIENHTKLDE